MTTRKSRKGGFWKVIRCYIDRPIAEALHSAAKYYRDGELSEGDYTLLAIKEKMAREKVEAKS